MVFFWLVKMVFKGKVAFVKSGFFLPVGLFFALVVFQLINLPGSVIHVLSSKTFSLYDHLVPAASQRPYFTLSIYPNATISEILKLLSFFGIFFLLINYKPTKKGLDRIINVIIFFGLAISLFGIIQKYSYPDRVYWFDAQDSASQCFGPFINHNNFAGYINMIIPLALGYSLTEMPLSKRVIYAICVVVMSLALFLSMSRGGLLVYTLTMLFFLLFSRLKEYFQTKVKTAFIWMIIIVCLGIIFIERRAVLERFSTLFRKETFAVFGHGYSWLDILKTWADFPLFGTGLGTFGNISTMYNSSASQTLFTYAHNDYLQLLSEVGLLGFILIIWFFAVYFKSVIKMWFERHDTYAICLVLGGLASLFSMLAYSLLDFNLHIPANTVLFFVIMGLVYRSVITRFEHARHR